MICSRLNFLTLFTLLLFAAGLEATRTPAGTMIRNQAVVTFQLDDETGLVFEASSNEVLIEVLPIFGIEITPDSTNPVNIPGNEAQLQYAVSAGDFASRQQVTLQYLLTFTGNVPDTATIRPLFLHNESDFVPQLADGDSGFLVYKDTNGNGIVDSGDVLVASWRDANLDGILDSTEISATTLGLNYQPDEVESLLVTFYVPTGRNAGDRVFFGLEGQSAGDPAEIDTGNYSLVQVTDGPVINLSKSAGAPTVAQGGSLLYTISAQNIGNEPTVGQAILVDGVNTYTGALVFDRVPVDVTTGLPFPLNAAATDNASTTNGTIVYSTRELVGESQNPEHPSFNPTGPDWEWTTIFDPAETYTMVGYITSDGATDWDMQPGESVSFLMTIDIPVNTLQQTILNKAFAHYGYGPDYFTITSRNQILTPVGGEFGVVIRDTDYLATPPPRTPADDGVADQQTQAMAQPGRAVYFTNRVINTGSVADTFNITLDPASDFPADWNVVFLKSDGTTPLADTGRDGIADTGVIQPTADVDNPQAGSYFDVVVRVDIPEKSTYAGPPASFIIRAASLGDPAQVDTTENFINALGDLDMDFENHVDDPGEPANWDPVTKTGDAGGYVDFPLIVRNMAPSDAETDIYQLTATTLPAGWTVAFYRDVNEDGILDPSETSRPLHHTQPVAPGENAFMIARVFIPAGTPADTAYDGTATTASAANDPYTVVFRATSSHQPDCSNPPGPGLGSPKTCSEITNYVVVNYKNLFHIEADRVGVIEPGSITHYEHTVINLSDRANRFYLSVTSSSADWRFTVLEDDDSGVTLPTALAPDGETYPYIDLDRRISGSEGTQGRFRLRLFAPAGTPMGYTDITTIQVLAWDPGSVDDNTQWEVFAKHFVVDLTTLVSGDLRLTKSSSSAYSQHVQPGSPITYTTAFMNRSAGPLKDVIIYDQISPYTTYERESGSVTFDSSNPPGYSFEISTDGGISYSADGPGPNVPRITNVRLVLDGDFEAGESGEYEFTVIVK